MSPAWNTCKLDHIYHSNIIVNINCCECVQKMAGDVGKKPLWIDFCCSLQWTICMAFWKCHFRMKRREREKKKECANPHRLCAFVQVEFCGNYLFLTLLTCSKKIWKQTAFNVACLTNALFGSSDEFGNFSASSHLIGLHPIMNAHTLPTIQLMMTTCATPAPELRLCIWWQILKFQSNLRQRMSLDAQLYTSFHWNW